MRIGFLQYSPVFGDKKGNLERVGEMLSKEKDAIIVLPELCFSGYLFKDRKELEELAEETPGPTVEYLAPITKNNNIFLVFGIAERAGERFYNSSLLLSPAGDISVYRKAHLFDKEKLIFTPGDSGFPIFNIEIKGVSTKVGLLICFDWIFPEPWKILALKGAQIIAHPANLMLPYCQDATITRAIENRIFIITSNRSGSERGLKFTGTSQIVGPRGEIYLRVGKSVEGVWTVECDLNQAEDKMVTERNDVIQDRREDLYTLKEK